MRTNFILEWILEMERREISIAVIIAKCFLEINMLSVAVIIVAVKASQYSKPLMDPTGVQVV